ncbi:MAG: ABC transporter permease [Chryseolinea sp.]
MFAVELIGIAVLREFNIVITAVLLAGRSASSFAAEIGAMKMNQEIDAMKVMGVDPFEALVFPRFVALLLTIPLLTFVATLAGMLGGMIVTWTALGLGPSFFLQRILDNVGADPLLGRPVQGPGHGRGDRRRRLPPGHGGRRRRGIPGPARHRRGGARDLRHHPDRCGLRPHLHEVERMRPKSPSHRASTEDAWRRWARPSRCAACARSSASQIVHKDLDLTIDRGDVLGVVGGSGTGKSVLLNTIIGLRRPQAGTVRDLRPGHPTRLAGADGRPSSADGACSSSRARSSPT